MAGERASYSVVALALFLHLQTGTYSEEPRLGFGKVGTGRAINLPTALPTPLRTLVRGDTSLPRCRLAFWLPGVPKAMTSAWNDVLFVLVRNRILFPVTK